MTTQQLCDVGRIAAVVDAAAQVLAAEAEVGEAVAAVGPRLPQVRVTPRAHRPAG